MLGRSTRGSIRAAALVALASFGAHQLRYLIGYGPNSGDRLSEHGHGYLAALLPELIGAAVVLLAATLVASALLGSGRMKAPASGRAQWLACSSALIAIFMVQETIEGVVSPGHPAGVAALTSGRAWVAAPLAMFFGALVIAVLNMLRDTDTTIALALRRRRALPRASRRLPAPIEPEWTPASICTLAFGFARRPPPRFS